MPAPPLSDLATDACISNIRRIYDVGDAPYSLVRRVLLKIEDPEQLREIEKASPQICGVDEELWRMLIKKQIPNGQEKIYEPKNPKNWWKVYRKLKREAEEELEEQEAVLKAALSQRAEEKGSNQMTFLNAVINPNKKKRRTPSPTKGANPSTLTFRSGSKTKLLTGKSIILKAKREAKEASLFQGRKSVLARPTHTLHEGASKINKIPKSLMPPGMPNRTSNGPTTGTSSSSISGNSGSTAINSMEPKPKASPAVTSPAVNKPSSAPAMRPNSPQSPGSAVSPVPKATPASNDSPGISKRRPPPNIFMPVKKQRRV